MESCVAIFALQRHDFHIARQGLIIQYAASGRDIDAALAVGNGTEFDTIRHGIAIFLTNGYDMDIVNIVFRRQVHNLALQGNASILIDATTGGADAQCSFVMGISHIAHQVDAAACIVGALDVNAALFCADKPDGDGLRGIHGIIVELDGRCTSLPAILDMLEPTEETGTPIRVFPV